MSSSASTIEPPTNAASLASLYDTACNQWNTQSPHSAVASFQSIISSLESNASLLADDVKQREKLLADSYHHVAEYYAFWRQPAPSDTQTRGELSIPYRVKAAAHGHELSTILCSLSGHGRDKNESQAVEQLKKFVELHPNDGKALMVLSLCVRDGKGDESPNANLASTLMLRAGELAHPHAMYELAEMYRLGDGLEADAQQAFMWCSRAAEKQVVPAVTSLAVYYATGEGVEKDISKAVELYTRAATQLGCPDALFTLGRYYQHGHGVEKDMNKAAELLMQSAERFDENAQLLLGNLYEADLVPASVRSSAPRHAQIYADTTIDDPLVYAAHWWWEAAVRRNAQAQFNLGKLYMEGSEKGGVKAEVIQAKKWLGAAAAQGDYEAMALLYQLFE